MNAARVRALAAGVVTFAAPVLALGGCRACGGGDSLAEIVTLKGTASRDFASHPQGWMTAGMGATFAVGDGLRTDKASTARLRLRHGGFLDVREETLLRFLTAAPSAERRVSLETGIAELEMGDEGIEFDTRFGAAMIDPGARVRVTAEGDTTRLEVIVGSAVVEGEDAGRLQPGQAVVFGADAGTEAAPPAPDAGAAPPPPPDVAVDPNAITVVIEGGGVQRIPLSTKGKPAAPEALAPGAATLDPGSHLLVPAGAKLAVRRGDESALVYGPSDVRVGVIGGALVEARTGRMTVEGAHGPIRLDVPGGTITVRGTSADPASADIVLGKHATDVFSRAGTTELHGKRSVVTLNAHQAARLDEAGFADAPAAAAPGPPQFTMPAGESATIHALLIPTSVRIQVGAGCGGAAYAEVSRGGRYLPAGVADTEQGSIVLNLGVGAQSYRVRCQDGSAGGNAGTLRVVHDAGSVRLPKTPPRDVIHADGRRYSVLYQNLLPALTLDWPDAPKGESFVLKVRATKDRIDETPAAAPSVSLAPGKLPEGAYGFWFETARDAKVRSLETTVRIAFDNAAPAAEIHEPDDGFQPTGGTVDVSGVAVEGVTVSVGETAIPLDAQFRFRGQVPISPGDHAIAIRIAHPTRGVQYYVRRIGGS